MDCIRIPWFLPVWVALKFPENSCIPWTLWYFCKETQSFLQRVSGRGAILSCASSFGCFIWKTGDVEMTLKHYRPIGCYLEWAEIAYE
jgi:hypothetical protein